MNLFCFGVMFLECYSLQFRVHNERQRLCFFALYLSIFSFLCLNLFSIIIRMCLQFLHGISNRNPLLRFIFIIVCSKKKLTLYLPLILYNFQAFEVKICISIPDLCIPDLFYFLMFMFYVITCLQFID